MAWKLQFKVCCEEVGFKIYETLNYYEKLRKVEQRKSSKRTRVDLVRSTCWLDHFVFGKIQLICIFAGPSEFGHCWTFGRIKHDSIVVVRTALVFSRNRQNRSNYIRQELVNVPVVVTEPHQTRPQLHGYSYLYRIQFQVGQGPSASPKYRTADRLRLLLRLATSARADDVDPYRYTHGGSISFAVNNPCGSSNQHLATGRCSRESDVKQSGIESRFRSPWNQSKSLVGLVTPQVEIRAISVTGKKFLAVA